MKQIAILNQNLPTQCKYHCASFSVLYTVTVDLEWDHVY